MFGLYLARIHHDLNFAAPNQSQVFILIVYIDLPGLEHFDNFAVIEPSVERAAIELHVLIGLLQEVAQVFLRSVTIANVKVHLSEGQTLSNSVPRQVLALAMPKEFHHCGDPRAHLIPEGLLPDFCTVNLKILVDHFENHLSHHEFDPLAHLE